MIRPTKKPRWVVWVKRGCLAGAGVVVAMVLGVVSVLVYWGVLEGRKIRGLQNRSDYPEIAQACIALAGTVTKTEPFMSRDDPRVPESLRALGVRRLTVATNSVTLEFHGGFDHYGYGVTQSLTNARQWEISWYTENDERTLATVMAPEPVYVWEPPYAILKKGVRVAPAGIAEQ